MIMLERFSHESRIQDIWKLLVTADRRTIRHNLWKGALTLSLEPVIRHAHLARLSAASAMVKMVSNGWVTAAESDVAG